MNHGTVNIDIEKYKSKLQAREQELLDDRGKSEHEVVGALSVEVGDVGDAVDLASSGEAREDTERSLDREYSELEEVQDALKRIEAGTYGICEICGKPIEPARLDAVPWTRYCLNDAIQREHFTPTSTL